uniref:EthD domain-containing protein n=1 Tax=Aetherobacter sp. TaxID=2022431 RepID=A0A3S7UV70_9BACT|nr:hypothetical protein [Aetherobacter sp.]
MFKIFAFLARKPELSPEAFLDYYENHHVPLICSLVPSPPVYKRSYLKRDDPFGLPGDAVKFDVVTEQVFADRNALEAWLGALSAPGVAALVRADEDRFLDRSHYFAYATEERVTANDPPL